MINGPKSGLWSWLITIQTGARSTMRDWHTRPREDIFSLFFFISYLSLMESTRSSVYMGI